LLALDAGLSTGWSYWRDGELVASGTWDMRPIADGDPVELLAGWTHHAEYVVMEVTKPYHGKLGRQLEVVQKSVQRTFPHVNHVQPWQWKPSHAKAKLPVRCKTTHERDAIRLGMWCLKDLGRFAPLHYDVL